MRICELVNGRLCRAGTAALLLLALGLGGCGSTGGSSALDLFSSSPKAKTETAADGTPSASADEVICPDVNIRSGAATLSIGGKPGETDPTALNLRYQGSISRTARECKVIANNMTMKVGIEGRVITGPAGGPGQLDVPLRIAVVQEGINPRPVLSKLVKIPVTLTADSDRVTFTHVDPDIVFPMPQRAGDIDAYVVYVGFDPQAAPEPKKKPVKPKARTAVKPRQQS